MPSSGAFTSFQRFHQLSNFNLQLQKDSEVSNRMHNDKGLCLMFFNKTMYTVSYFDSMRNDSTFYACI